MDQYRKRKNTRIYGVPQSTKNRDDGKKVAHENTKKLNVNLNSADIQRAYRLGWRKRTMQKPRPIIVRFISCNKRNEFMLAKSRLQEIDNYANCFVTKDLKHLYQNFSIMSKTNAATSLFWCIL